MSDTPVSKMSFEEAMTQLEAVVAELEGGEVGLDQSIKLYERGAELRSHCEAKLREAEEKVSAITLDGSGKPTGSEPLDSDSG